MTAALQVLALIAGALLWVPGLRVFLRSELSTGHKIVWTSFLFAVGVAIGALLAGPSIWHKFVRLLVVLPVLAALDLAFLKPRRTLSFWLRVCGYEVCTVFGVASLTRIVLNRLGISPLLSS